MENKNPTPSGLLWIIIGLLLCYVIGLTYENNPEQFKMIFVALGLLISPLVIVIIAEYFKKK